MKRMLIALLFMSFFCLQSYTYAAIDDYPLDICVVDEVKLGTKGKPIKFLIRGDIVYLCCKACKTDVWKNLDKYHKRIKNPQKFTGEINAKKKAEQEAEKKKQIAERKAKEEAKKAEALRKQKIEEEKDRELQPEQEKTVAPDTAVKGEKV